MLIMSAWCLAYAAQLLATDLSRRTAWFLVCDALTLPAAAASLWFAVEYAALDRWLTRRWAAVLWGSVIALLATYLVDGGRLVWSDLRVDGFVEGEVAPIGIVLTAWILVLALSATAVFVILFIRSPAHRAPVVLILAGHIALRMAFLVAALDVRLRSEIPTVVLAIDFTALMYTIALFQFRLFDLLPIARAMIVERIPDGLLVLDADGGVAELNVAAQRLLGVRLGRGRRELAQVLLGHHPALVERIVGAGSGPVEASVETGAGVRIIEVTGSALTDWRQRPIGRLVLLHDITALRDVEARLLEQAGAIAAIQERERLARELHDGLAQDLWLVKLKATRLAAKPGLDDEARALSQEIATAVDAGIAEAHQVVATLRGSDATNGSLKSFLSRSLEDFEDRFGLAVEWECPADLPALPARAEVEVLRIVGEALTNVRRHADATVVRVRGSMDDSRLSLEVRDNGRGFDPASLAMGSFGVAGMRERAAQIGGKLEIEFGAAAGHAGAPKPARLRGSRGRGGCGMTAESARPRIRVMIVDDHPLVRNAVRQALDTEDLEVVAEAASAEEALEVAPRSGRTSSSSTSSCPAWTGCRWCASWRRGCPKRAS